MQYRIEKLANMSGEALAREMLSPLTGIPAAALDIRRSPRGKPYLADSGVSFSISHSGELLLCAVHTAPVGADIEQPGPYRDRVARRVCSPAEYAYIGGDAVRFLEVWTRKEAYAKLTGEGLAAGFARIPVADSDRLLPEVCGCAVQTQQTDGYVFSVVWQPQN